MSETPSIPPDILVDRMEQGEKYGWKTDEPSKEIVDAFEQGFIKPGDHVLDVGCGYGGNANWLAEKGCTVTAININGQELKHAEAKAKDRGVTVTYIRADAAILPVKDNSFDVVLDMGCTHMLTRENQERAAQEFGRVAKDDAHFLYFGFNKEHSKAASKPDNPQFRDLPEVEQQFSQDFEILEHEVTEWSDNETTYKGILATMKRKPRQPEGTPG
jgi:ubiquinone/menaquinone biosynthesis C-methylase UbiE